MYINTLTKWTVTEVYANIGHFELYYRSEWLRLKIIWLYKYSHYNFWRNYIFYQYPHLLQENNRFCKESGYFRKSKVLQRIWLLCCTFGIFYDWTLQIKNSARKPKVLQRICHFGIYFMSELLRLRIVYCPST